MIRAKLYLVRGRVQGVGYRWFASRAAQRLGVAGYVKNVSNGDVEVRAQAEEAVLAEFKRELELGPPASRVGAVVEDDIPVNENDDSFFIR